MDFEIVVVPPDTPSNWREFNRDCDVLDSDYLMQPVNEADYDSETQACVDARTGGPASFYDHYVTKRRKKKGKKGCTVEGPAPIATPSPQPVFAQQDLLTVPGTQLPKGLLSNVAVRRIACGRMPPPSWSEHPHGTPPPYDLRERSL